nr:transposase [Francisella hispaniensis]
MDKNIVYGDESGFAYSMARTHGYTPKGQKCYGVKDFGNKNRTNAIGVLYNGNLICVGLLTVISIQAYILNGLKMTY